MPGDQVLLACLPWNHLALPSIQLGTLKVVLEKSGFRTTVRSYFLSFMQRLVDRRGFAPSDYDAILKSYNGLGDWIFLAPPFADPPPSEIEAYLALLRERGLAEDLIEKATTMREEVPAFLDECARDIVASGARVIGFTTTFNQNVPSLGLSKLLKERRPDLTILFGGSNCEGAMGEGLHRAFPWIDVVVRGEAELVLPAVVRDLVSDREVRPQPGLCLRQPGSAESTVIPDGDGTIVSMDVVPAPDYDEYFERLGSCSFAPEVSHAVEVLFETARGCWWGETSHCTFCGLSDATMKFRSKSPDAVVQEVMELSRRYKSVRLRAVDNILDLSYFNTVLPRLREAAFDLTIFFEAKSNLTKAQVRLLADAGIYDIQPGIESFSTPILKLMRKGVTGLHNVRLLKWCAEFGIRPQWNLLYGLPREPPEEFEKMAGLIPSLVHLVPPRFIPLHLDRFSPYFERPAEHGIELCGPEAHYSFLYPVDASLVSAIAFDFEFRHLDGRDPSQYTRRVRAAVERWRAEQAANERALTYFRGPGFVKIIDRRTTVGQYDHTLAEVEGAIYLRCDAGATVPMIAAHLRELGHEVPASAIGGFLHELVAKRLAMVEDGRYLALAIAGQPNAAVDFAPPPPAHAHEKLVSLLKRKDT